jgi:RNA polymerase sigma factor (sigma-70 family)
MTQATSHLLGIVLPREVKDEAVQSASFEALYRVSWPRVYGFIRCQVHDASLAQEIAARTYLKVLNQADRVPAGSEAVLWILRVAHNTLIDYWRVEGRRQAASISIDELSETPTAQLDPEALYRLKELQALLVRLMGELEDRERTLLALKFGAQRTNAEIARILGASEAAISMRLFRALRRLRKRLRELGV